MASVLRSTAAAALVLLAARPAVSQSVIGRVIDDATDLPLPFTAVMLLDSTGIAVDVDQADSAGWFDLLPPAPGDYAVFADRMSHDKLMSPPIELKEASSVQLELRMMAVPVRLEGISISTERRRVRLEEEGFYRRRDQGIGYFLGPDEIRDYRPLFTTDLFRQIPGARVRPNMSSYGSTVTLRGMGLVRECRPRIVLNGWPLAAGFTLDEFVHPDAVMAVEVYPSGAGAPPRHVGLVGGCGVILVWTY